jgi:Sulfotransferase family
MKAPVPDPPADTAIRPETGPAASTATVREQGSVVKVLYVMGRGRSGSTILGNVLGEADGFFAAGEVRELFDPVLRRPDSVCACGEPVRECPVWSGVLERLPEVDLAAVARWQHDVIRERRLHRLRHRRDHAGGATAEAGDHGATVEAGDGSDGDEQAALTAVDDPWPELTSFARVMSHVYLALAEQTGARVIVDTSKRPSYGMFLQHVAGCEPYYVQVVRDPRASAHSWKTRRYVGSSGDTVTRRGAADATLRWDLLNLGAEATLRSAPPERRFQLRFEDFAASPRDTVQRLTTFVGEDAPSPFRDDRTIDLGTNHSIAGNPSRQRIGDVVIHEVDDWSARFSRLDRWLATLIAVPFLRRYGYALRPWRRAPHRDRPRQ